MQTRFARGKPPKSKTMKVTTPFVTGVIDPDWPYTAAPGKQEISATDSKGRLSGFTRSKDPKQNKYLQHKPMSIKELGELRISDLIGGYLLMWVVGPFLINGSAQRLMEAWGFTPVSILTWAKYDLKAGHGYGGVGYWFLGNAEFVMVGKREGWPSIRTGCSSLIIQPKGRHSSKPDDIHQLCEERFPGPYVELFGRRSRPGWTVLGNEAPGDGEDIRSSIMEVLT